MSFEIAFSWAWTPHLLSSQAKADRRRSSPLILPEDFSPTEDEQEPALCHWSRMQDGQQYSWLWLFPAPAEAMALRLLPKYVDERSDGFDLIRATLPDDLPGKPKNCYLQMVPKTWAEGWNLEELGIYEVWWGFNYRAYARSRSLVRSTLVFSAEEFREWMRRKVA